MAVYVRLYDKDYPVVCTDEKSVQFFSGTRKRFRNHGIEYYDNEYIRNGKHFSVHRTSEEMEICRYPGAQDQIRLGKTDRMAA